MDFGLHLPLIDFGNHRFTLDRIAAYAETAHRLGFRALAANNHLVFSKPWLDGVTALASILPYSGNMDLATTVALPVVYGPVPLAKSLAAIDCLSGGRLIAGVGPGSSARDYALARVPFEERWPRFDESIRVLRSLWRRDSADFRGNFYSTEGIHLEPFPAQRSGPPIWVGSWGSSAGLKRVARLADGWLASGYNTTPELFTRNWLQLQEFLLAEGKEPASFPNSIVTMWFYLTENKAEAERMVSNVLGPMLNRPTLELKERLPIGSKQDCAEKLSRYQAAGAQRIYLWPLADELEQIKLFMEQVVPWITRDA